MRVTIAIPAYDEVTNLERAVMEARAEIAAVGPAGDGEVLVVDDGSRDGTSALADELAAAHADVRVVHHERNRGFSGAMATCFRQARGDWVFLAPADGQSSMSELGKFLEMSSRADVIVGVRESRADHAGRQVMSRTFHGIARALLAIPVPEFSSIFLFRRALLETMPFRSRERSATILPEILFRARQRNATFATVVVPHFPRRSGRAKGGSLAVAFFTLVELVRLAVLVRLDELRNVPHVET
jgi:glycosyltransferase involved in cell wall biosynthesis